MEGTDYYAKWKAKHAKACLINHTKSSGAMESIGAVEISSSSITKHKLRYSHYTGDGDTDSFKKAVEARPYSLIPSKLECVGHVQQSLGTRLRNFRQQYKGKKLPDNKP